MGLLATGGAAWGTKSSSNLFCSGEAGFGSCSVTAAETTTLGVIGGEAAWEGCCCSSSSFAACSVVTDVAGETTRVSLTGFDANRALRGFFALSFVS